MVLDLDPLQNERAVGVVHEEVAVGQRLVCQVLQDQGVVLRRLLRRDQAAGICPEQSPGDDADDEKGKEKGGADGQGPVGPPGGPLSFEIPLYGVHKGE